MFSLFKKDPLHKELKQAKKIKKAEDKRLREKQKIKEKKEKRILKFLVNKICPICGSTVKSSTKHADTGRWLRYTCTKNACSFTKSYYFGENGKKSFADKLL